MQAFYIVLISLWIYPPLVYLIFFLTRKRLPLRKQLAKWVAFYTLFVIGCLLIHIATSNFSLNIFLFFTLYFTVALLFNYGASRQNLIVRSLSYIVLVLMFIVGYISSTIGMLGLGMILTQYEPQKTLVVKSNVIYKEYGLGSAISDWGGTEVALYHKFAGLPFIEHRFFDKRYTGDDQSKSNRGLSSNKKGFYVYRINIAYDTSKDLLIVKDASEKNTTDTIFLYKMR